MTAIDNNIFNPSSGGVAVGGPGGRDDGDDLAGLSPSVEERAHAALVVGLQHHLVTEEGGHAHRRAGGSEVSLKIDLISHET